MADKSLVIELQEMARTETMGLPELLRAAKTVAAKLTLTQVSAWIDHELSGYPEGEDVPAYRKAPCALKYLNPLRGWQPVTWEDGDQDAETFGWVLFPMPVAQIASLLNGEGSERITCALSPSELAHLCRRNPLFQRYQAAKFVSMTEAARILDAVRNRILEWSLKLESEGILGEGVSFTQQEKTTAQHSQQITHIGGTFIQGPGANVSSITNSPGANVGQASTGATLTQNIQQIRTTNPDLGDKLEKFAAALAQDRVLDAEARTEAQEQLQFLVEQAAVPAAERKPKSLLKPMLTALGYGIGVSSDLVTIWKDSGLGDLLTQLFLS